MLRLWPGVLVGASSQWSPVRANAKVEGSIPAGVCTGGNWSMFLSPPPSPLSVSFYVCLFLSQGNKYILRWKFFKKKKRICWGSDSFYSFPSPRSMYFSSTWFSSYSERWLWTSHPYSEGKREGTTPTSPCTRKATLYPKPQLPPQVGFSLHFIGCYIITWSLTCKETGEVNWRFLPL